MKQETAGAWSRWCEATKEHPAVRTSWRACWEMGRGGKGFQHNGERLEPER